MYGRNHYEYRRNIESLENLLNDSNFTPGVIFGRIELLFDSVSKYSDQAHLTIGHLQGYLNEYLKCN